MKSSEKQLKFQIHLQFYSFPPMMTERHLFIIPVPSPPLPKSTGCSFDNSTQHGRAVQTERLSRREREMV